jgi:hypothetical protein
MFDPDDPEAHRLIDLATGAYAQKLESQVTAHPVSEALVAYQEGRLVPAQAEQVRNHLVVCPSCAEAFQRLDEFDRELEDQDLTVLIAPSAKQSWTRFHKLSSMEAVRLPARKTRFSLLTSTSRWPTWALAASILLAAAGGFSFYLSLFQHNASKQSLGSNPFVFDLWPDGWDARRNSTGIEIINVPVEMDPIVPHLLLGDQSNYSSYSATLSSASGEILWKQSGLRRQPSGGFVLLIPRAGVPRGDYMLRLLGEQQGSSRVLASYTFRLQYLE